MKFRGQYWFMSNMYPSVVETRVNGTALRFTCAEAAFQAVKCPARAREFVGLDGFEAKSLGRRVRLREDWNDVRVGVMRDVVRDKFARNPDLLRRLRAVAGRIEEENAWNDTFWGTCDGVGENHLGRILEEVRDAAS